MTAQALLGEVTTQILVASTATLGVPAVKIDEIVASVTDLSCTVITGKVIFQGILDEQIFFVDGNGLVRHQAEDVRFSGFVDFPGALGGETCELEAIIEFIEFRLVDPVTLRQAIVIAVTVRLFDPPVGRFFGETAPAARATFFGDRTAYRTSGRRTTPGRSTRVRLATG